MRTSPRRARVLGPVPPRIVAVAHRLRLELEVCGSPRNLLGPNHLPEKRPAWTGPGEFVGLDEWVEERNLVPYGLFGDVTVQILR